MRCSVYIVYPAVLSCSNLKLHQTLEVKNIFQTRKHNVSVARLTLDGLTLISFRTARPWRISTLIQDFAIDIMKKDSGFVSLFKTCSNLIKEIVLLYKLIKINFASIKTTRQRALQSTAY